MISNSQGRSFYYDIEMVYSNGRKRTILTGKYKYEQDITK